MKKINSLAFFGTGSDVGKSVVAAAVCRCLSDRTIKAAPFKAQNMSNNSGITPQGLEMGRAQIVQAEAARIPPHTDMNPILLKPTADNSSQVVVNGRVYEDLSAADYHERNKYFFEEACAAYDRLAARHETIVIEGAGSCAEVNLIERDIVNFRMAEYANADVVLVADIHKGGVFAQIIGTLACLPKKYQRMVKGFVINRFRGDPELFTEGVRWIEHKTEKPVFGVLPWFFHFRLDAEDSVEIEKNTSIQSLDPDKPAIGVIRLPRISNFTDIHSLSEIEGIQVAYVDRPLDLSLFKAVILPGSKSTRADMEWLEQSGLSDSIKKYAETGGHVLGICGGYQMLGRLIRDDQGVEGRPGCIQGLGLLNIETGMCDEKTTTLSSFSWDGVHGEGYEIHMGETRIEEPVHWFCVHQRNGRETDSLDGCVSSDGKVAGTYIHGLFDTPAILDKWLSRIGISEGLICKKEGRIGRDQTYTLLKEHFEESIDVSRLLENV